MEYRINSIKHAGRFGDRGKDRADSFYSTSIGRIVDVKTGLLEKGSPFILWYLGDSDGSDYSDQMLITSPIRNVQITEDVIIVETNNSIYELVRAKELDQR